MFVFMTLFYVQYWIEFDVKVSCLWWECIMDKNEINQADVATRRIPFFRGAENFCV